MDTRVIELYRLIEKLNGRKICQLEICNVLNKYYKYSTDENTHDHCYKIWKDITEINTSDEFEKIIIQKNFEYWIASEEEAKKYAEVFFKKGIKSLKRYWKLKNKIKTNGSVDVMTEKENKRFSNKSIDTNN